MPQEKTNQEVARLDYELAKADAAGWLKYQVDLAQIVLRSLVLVNGGAMIALFTLIGNHGEAIDIDAAAIRTAFAWFIAGLSFALAASIGGFLSQFWYGLCTQSQVFQYQARMLGIDESYPKIVPYFRRGTWALSAAIVLIVASLATFCIGGGVALDGVLATTEAAFVPTR